MANCSMCGIHACYSGDSNLPGNCPTKELSKEELKEKYYTEETHQISQVAAIVEAEGYCRLTRVEETMAFAKKCGFKNLGLAFCVGLRREAQVLTRVFKNNEFEVESVMCKVGSFPKEFLGLTDQQKIRPGQYEAMCNPIAQAELLDKAQTQLNIILGLCVGHDTVFIKHSQAPVTVIAVKDRVLGHNPLAAVYLAEGYYKSKLNPTT